MAEFLARLKQRKLVQWALAYIAAAFALIQVLDVVASKFDWPTQLERSIILALAVGFVIVLVIAWYHGEKGRQRVSGAELLLLALVLAIGGGVVWYFGRSAGRPVAGQAPAAGAATAPGASGIASIANMPAGLPVPAQAIPAQSVAVLPFQNLSGDEKETYFSEGVTEEILNALAQIPDLKVAGRTSAFQFAGKDEDVRKVGAILGVATVLEGSVQKAGDEVRITAQLIDARSGYQLWSEQYDRKLTSIFAVEDDISNAIAGKLRVQWNSAQPLVAQKAIDPRAHDFYLRGLGLLAARGPGLRDAVSEFRNAVGIAPDYAEAWGAMAEAEALYPDYRLDAPQQAYPRALAAAQRALALDPDTASAYVAQGMIYKRQSKWPDADAAFRRALALAPGDVETIYQYAEFLLVVGQAERALAETGRVQRLDPLEVANGFTRASTLYVLHRHEAAWEQIQRTVAALPELPVAREDAIFITLTLHRYSEAENQARLLAPLFGPDPDAATQLAGVVQAVADPALRARALRTLDTAPVWVRVRDDNPMVYAAWLMLLGDRDRSLAMLDRIADQGGGETSVEDLWFPVFDPLRDDPRFKAVLKKMGLPYTPASISNHE
ncbi:MAG: Adenylate cyclase [Rhodanobacteraceae bacterium]|jgi:TolB-like protein/Tfp pilus assembly protein PilF|nr:MAG: Adenylate cyclase [Rhodanobacteraceae bacterium]